MGLPSLAHGRTRAGLLARRLTHPAARALLAGLLLWPLASPAQTLPAEVLTALQRAQVPAQALSVWVMEAQTSPAPSSPRLSHQSQVMRNPASVMKLVTTLAALDVLGPAYSWRTPVYLQGTQRGEVLQGNVIIQGLGDPKLVMERVWLLLRRLRGLGIARIEGDIVLDRSAFALGPSDPGEFDGERLRPYNAAPDALLLNYHAMVLTFSPDRAKGVAWVQLDPPLAGVQVAASVPLAEGTGCDDYRSALKAEFTPLALRFAGRYPAACGERVWPVAYPEPERFDARALLGLWQSLGGQLSGSVREGRVPAGLAPRFELTSPPLAEVIRDINKYSNNVMAQQLFLTLSLAAGSGAGANAGLATGAPPASLAASREVVGAWWRSRLGEDAPVLDNGSGLSRQERISAAALGRLLQHGWSGPNMPDWLASLPISGVDGTLKRMGGKAGSAHLKTGSLRDVASLAGVVHAQSGKRYLLVAIVNHPNANAARGALDALVNWTAQDQ